jgi:hypothetical protein
VEHLCSLVLSPAEKTALYADFIGTDASRGRDVLPQRVKQTRADRERRRKGNLTRPPARTPCGWADMFARMFAVEALA